jgi:hypothetical protein
MFDEFVDKLVKSGIHLDFYALQDEFSKALLLYAQDDCYGVTQHTADLLHMKRTTCHQLLQKHGILHYGGEKVRIYVCHKCGVKVMRENSEDKFPRHKCKELE